MASMLAIPGALAAQLYLSTGLWTKFAVDPLHFIVSFGSQEGRWSWMVEGYDSIIEADGSKLTYARGQP